MNEQYLDFNFCNILYFSLTPRYCAHYKDNIYNSYTQQRAVFSLKKTQMKRERSPFRIYSVVMTRPS